MAALTTQSLNVINLYIEVVWVLLSDVKKGQMSHQKKKQIENLFALCLNKKNGKEGKN